MLGAGIMGGGIAQLAADKRIAVTRELGAFKTSMLQDFEAGRTPEIDAILAAPCEIGDRYRREPL